MAFSIYGNGVVQKRENVLFLGEGTWFVRGCRYEDWTEIGKWVIGE